MRADTELDTVQPVFDCGHDSDAHFGGQFGDHRGHVDGLNQPK